MYQGSNSLLFHAFMTHQARDRMSGESAALWKAKAGRLLKTVWTLLEEEDLYAPHSLLFCKKLEIASFHDRDDMKIALEAVLLSIKLAMVRLPCTTTTPPIGSTGSPDRSDRSVRMCLVEGLPNSLLFSNMLCFQIDTFNESAGIRESFPGRDCLT